MTHTLNQKITFREFKDWLNQLIASKRGALPNLDDWKLIKEKIDQVETYDLDFQLCVTNNSYDPTSTVEEFSLPPYCWGSKVEQLPNGYELVGIIHHGSTEEKE
jgi:hypothetical protein